YYTIKDKVYNWQIIRKMIPEKAKKSGYSPYQSEDIQKMLESCGRSKRNRALIHFLASTGCRVGAIPGLTLKHISQMEECKAVLLYEGTNYEYSGFMTPDRKSVV